MKQNPIIVLFQRDLRLSDNPALSGAAETKAPLIFLYVLDEKTPGKGKIGSAEKWWLHQSLKALQGDLSKKRCKLILRKGALRSVVLEIAKKTKAQAVYYNRLYEPWFKDFRGIESKAYNGTLLHDPSDLFTKSGGPFKVFTPFWNAAQKDLDIGPILKVPKLSAAKLSLRSDTLSSWKLEPQKPNWAKGFSKYWTPGEKGALKQLQKFTKSKLGQYHQKRDIPGVEGTSKLSPHLHMGEISPLQVWKAAQKQGASAKKFRDELGWREFSTYLLYHFPDLAKSNFNPKFNKMPWVKNTRALNRWKEGLTGYPIVDAGMRELWATGWMHNRVRMIVASFLTKDLLIHWKEGAKWFQDTLVDADLANNSASWQWVAGSGADAAPFFRIFNPTSQGMQYDPKGDYVRKWVPELSRLKGKEIHEPWKSELELDYPDPIVDHKEAREKALQGFKKVK